MQNHSTVYRLVLVLLLALAAFAPAGLHAQNFRMRAANLIEGIQAIDLFANNSPTALIGNVAYEEISGQTSGLSFTSPLNIRISPRGAGAAAAIVNADVPVEPGFYYTALAYGTSAQPKLKMLERRFEQVPAQERALLQVFHGATFTAPVDIYLDSTTGTPLFSQVVRDSATPYVNIEARSATLIVTAAGTKNVLAQFDAPITNRQVLTMIISGASTSSMVVHSLETMADPTVAHPIPVLQPRQGQGPPPTLRVVNALPQSGARRLDVYLNGTQKVTTVHYRAASGVLPSIPGALGITLVPAEGNPNDSVFGRSVMLNLDTAYAMVLTEFQSGAVVSMMLSRWLSEEAPASDMSRIRFANATDHYGDLTFVLRPSGAESLAVENLAFLSSSPWATIPAAPATLQVFRAGTAAPIFEGSFTPASASTMTFIAMGDETRFTVDVLNHSDPAPQSPLGSFGAQEVGVPMEAPPAAIALAGRPNPFSSTTQLAFELASAGETTLELFDATGVRVTTLVDGWREAGRHQVSLDAAGLPSGVYTALLRRPGAAPVAAKVVLVGAGR